MVYCSARAETAVPKRLTKKRVECLQYISSQYLGRWSQRNRSTTSHLLHLLNNIRLGTGRRASLRELYKPRARRVLRALDRKNVGSLTHSAEINSLFFRAAQQADRSLLDPPAQHIEYSVFRLLRLRPNNRCYAPRLRHK